MFEKVNPMHPDKVADRIAGALVDLAYRKAENPKIAVEVLIGHGKAFIIAETSIKFYNLEIRNIVARISGITQVQYVEVPQDSHLLLNQIDKIRCGDNGIFKGMPLTQEQELLTAIAASIYERWPHDGKYIIQSEEWSHTDTEWSTIICQSHLCNEDVPELLEYLHNNCGINNVSINPLGPWTGGTDVDCGATNRKLGSDMGDAVTGGGLHGKDLSKADVTLNIYCHLKAQELGHEYKLCCAIGDEYVDGKSYSELVGIARKYIEEIGGFEKFAEWGLIR